MTEPMTWLLLLRLGAAAVSVALAAAILARDHGLKPNRLIAALLFGNAWWALMEFFLGLQSDPEVATWLLRWMTLGWVPMGVLCMHASVLLSSTDAPRVARSIPFLYGALAICLPLAIATDWVIAGAEKTSIGWQGIFGPGVVVAYGLLMTPAVATLVRWRGVMAFPRSGGQLQLSRIVFYGVLGALIEGTLSGIVLPLLGYDGIGISTTLIALVGVAAAWTLHRFGHALISPEAFAREILDTLEDGVVLIGEGGDLRGANRAFFRMIGERERTVFGRPISDWIPDFDERLASAEGPAFMQVSTRDGSMVPVVVSSPVEIHGSGRIVGRAYLLRDRREIVSLQRRLVVSARLAAVGDLSKSISHTIEAPIGRTHDELSGLSEEWRRLESWIDGMEPDAASREALEEGRELVQECLEGVDRISRIILEVGGFPSEGSTNVFERQPLEQIVTNALRIACVQAPGWLDIETRLDPDVSVRCNRSEMERVVTNLLVNAIQALEENPKQGAHLVVGVASQGDRALLHIEDDGCGIEPEVLDRIFDPFFTTKPVGKGTGLGLVISYHIVKAHGGEIRVSSVAGRGTSVTVELPRADPLASARA